MPPTKPLPEAVYRLVTKRGKNDCAIAVLATYLRQEYEVVLIASAKVSSSAWQEGLTQKEILRTAARLKTPLRMIPYTALDDDFDETTGLLWIEYNHVSNRHVVFQHKGWIFDPEDDPISLWEWEEFMRINNAYPIALYTREER
jgi:ABC-type bacteriocin/lantibiotic exporter with double-glycine peptidase domain